MLKLFKKTYVTGILLFSPMACFAGDGDIDTSKLRVAIGAGLGIILLFGFGWCINVVWDGVKGKKKGDPEWANAILAGLLIPGAIIIVAIAFGLLGLSGAITKPTFDGF